MHKYESAFRITQAALTCIAIVLGGWWFIARDAWTHRVEITATQSALSCLNSAQKLLSVEYKLANVGDRSIQMQSEAYQAFDLHTAVESAPSAVGRYPLKRIEDVPSDPVPFRVLERPHDPDQGLVYFVRPGSNLVFWRDFVFPTKYLLVRLHAEVITASQNVYATSGTFNIAAECD